jgi:hypothetical protein
VPGLPENLPLLDAFVRERRPRAAELAGVDALFVQHHLGHLVPRLKQMLEDGLEPKRCWLADIPYSTSECVRTELLALGIPSDQMTAPLHDPLVPYCSAQLRRVADLVQRMLERGTPRRLLVVDDGAYFVRAAHSFRVVRPGFVEALRGRVHIVEQTTRGHRWLLEAESQETLHALDAPAVSVARATAKTELEAPFIGASTARGLRRALVREGVDAGQLDRIAVVGFGPVGRATFHSLRHSRSAAAAPIDVVDIDARVHADIERDGGRPLSRLSADPCYDLVVGCTGYTAFQLDDRLCLASEAVLASASSAAVEFNRAGFVELANRLPDDDVEILDAEATRRAGIRATIRFRDAARTISFLHAGFPVNFDGEIDCLPARIIQTTDVLLYAAAYESLALDSPGLYLISPETDDWVVENGIEFL